MHLAVRFNSAIEIREALSAKVLDYNTCTLAFGIYTAAATESFFDTQQWIVLILNPVDTHEKLYAVTRDVLGGGDLDGENSLYNESTSV